jgi:hypothetical protein
MNIITNLSDDFTTPCGLTIEGVKTFISSALTASSGRGKKPILTAEELETRPVYIQPTEEQISDMPSNAVIVAVDYPFGRHKCVAIQFMEWRNKHGYRRVFATSDKEFSKFNAPKFGTYTMGVVSVRWYTEGTGKQHAEFTIHRLNIYDPKMTNSVENAKKYKAEAETLLSLNLLTHDLGFVKFYIRLCDKKIETLLQKATTTTN